MQSGQTLDSDARSIDFQAGDFVEVWATVDISVPLRSSQPVKVDLMMKKVILLR